MSDDIQRIREVLAFIPADDRDRWLRMGMAIKSELVLTVSPFRRNLASTA
ncbi:MAG: PriCT-2 domain-containing protein [Candidatus Accumulibacter sp.]|nr:PriCT-2 domain-containing protein [Accumulibacter sp.]MBL8369620.1 PriCT-2 domain-containing protein [Accumulibacter sp.]